MNKVIKTLVGGLILSFGVTNLFAQSNVGTTAATFLTIDPSPRAVGMGGAFSAISDDASAPYWNVAGIASFKQPQFQVTKINYLVGTDLVYASGAVPMGEKGVIGVSLLTFDSGDIEITTHQEQEGTGKTFKVKDSAFAINYGYIITNRFQFGVTAKFISTEIAATEASTFALDFGGKFTADLLNLRLGFVINNFGGKMQLTGNDLTRPFDGYENSTGHDEFVPVNYQTGEFDIPLLFRFGIAIDPLKTDWNRLTISSDALHPNDQDVSVSFGTEYAFREMFFARAGYNSLFEGDTEEGFTFGFGVKYKVAKSATFALDYAFKDYGLLGNSTFWNISLIFN